MAALDEDDIYRTSTQYRLWAFTPSSVATLRTKTNSLAAEGVRAAIQSMHLQKQAVEPGEAAYDDPAEEVEVDCLTVDEEQKLVGFYCVKAMQLADFLDFPTNVKVRALRPIPQKIEG